MTKTTSALPSLREQQGCLSAQQGRQSAQFIISRFINSASVSANTNSNTNNALRQISTINRRQCRMPWTSGRCGEDCHKDGAFHRGLCQRRRQGGPLSITATSHRQQEYPLSIEVRGRSVSSQWSNDGNDHRRPLSPFSKTNKTAAIGQKFTYYL
jgi:hypothetical protein